MKHIQSCCFAYYKPIVVLTLSLDIGYVGKSNNKRLTKTDQHVDDAFMSRLNHKHNELVIYIEEEKRTHQGQKRKLSTTRNGRWINFIYYNCWYLMSLLLLS